MVFAVIENHCKKTLNKILSDPNHPITKSLPTRDTTKTSNKFPIAVQRCNKQKYQNSFLQQYLRILEAEHLQNVITTKIPINPTKVEHVNCEICGKTLKSQKGLNCHKRLIHQPPVQQPKLKNITKQNDDS